MLDTWFSSGLWPFSTLGWPEETPDLKTFYPTDTLITGFDIIFFWVARMIMLGLHFMDDVPFRDVYIHALVRDAEGQKMSKSKGNVVDPLVVMDKYGTDAFRFTLAALAGLGRDIRISEEWIEGYRNFANKIWNASRFVLTNLDGYDPALARKGEALDRRPLDREPPQRHDGRGPEGARHLPLQRRGHGRVPVPLERVLRLVSRDRQAQPLPKRHPVERAVTQRTLVETLDATLRLLHPFMPFISEEIWQRLPREEAADRAAYIMSAPFPKAGRKGRDAAAEAEMAPVIAVVSAIRTVRSESRISPAVELTVTVKCPPRTPPGLRDAVPLISALARARVTVDPQAARPPQSAHAVAGGADVFVLLEGVVDVGAERAAPEGDRQGAEGDELSRGQARAAGLRRARAGRRRGAGPRAARRAGADPGKAHREPGRAPVTMTTRAPSRRLGHTIHRMGAVASTQGEAARLAAAGASEGTVVTATHQSAGRGRRGPRVARRPGRKPAHVHRAEAAHSSQPGSAVVAGRGRGRRGCSRKGRGDGRDPLAQ